MAISLFPHNQTAYDSLLAMLESEQKVCVVHPTGTGKSFIGFKYCEDHPAESVLWLSPSEYIIKTQCENLTATGATVPGNIKFLTYAKLSIMTEEQLDELAVDTIIEDEFHRTGAPTWGDGLKRLMKRRPNARHIGLSATNIRYLDNQRDIGIEFYEGNIASLMTLGEAIVRGILNAPTYVLSVFAYQQDYDRLKSRVRRAKSKAVRDEADKYLEALRRALEQADGLDVIFDKYMTDRHGKYLAFCANAEHMREMMGHVDEWFGKIDPAPHVYSAYSDDPATSKAFADFKADAGDHLKLLFCIDMLNEGVHVEDVSGVILFRPTVSPIIYKQQIGRALSASKSKDPIIFDVVNNIENLYSISTIEQEMRAAVSYYRFYGDGGAVVNERFHLIDEVRDARELFERLNDTLVASWDLMYDHAWQYYEQYGDLDVPRRYKTADGYSLGAWLQTQRKVYAGEQYGVLGEDRIEKLDALGMRWGSYTDEAWERYYRAAQAYYEAHGDLKVNATQVTDNGIALGNWIARLRTYKKSGIRNSYLTPDRVAAMERIGMVWDVPDYLWEENYHAAMRYYREHGDLDMANTYVTPDGLRLGTWVFKQRTLRGDLSQEQIKRLDSIGMIWEPKHKRAWAQGYEEAKRYVSEHGDCNVPATYVSPSGYALGRWLNRQRDKGKANHTPEQQAQLDALGFVWDKPDPWETRYALAKTYYEAHGDLNMPADYKPDGIWVAKWLNEQRQIYIGKRKGKSLTDEQIERLNAIGMQWDGRWNAAWMDGYRHAEAYIRQLNGAPYKTNYVSEDGYRTGAWISVQLRALKQGTSTPEHTSLLKQLGLIDEPKGKKKPWAQTHMLGQQGGQEQAQGVFGK